MTFIKNENRRMETFFGLSDALTFFSHKVIFLVDNNIKKLGNICCKMKIEAAFEYMLCYSNSSVETNMELEQ